MSTPAQAAPDIGQLQQEVADLRQRLAESDALFELQHSRMGAATALWRQQDPAARNGVLPDLGQLLDWLMAQAELASCRLAELNNALNWHTACLGCASVLDASYQQTVRAEQAEAQLADYQRRVRAALSAQKRAGVLVGSALRIWRETDSDSGAGGDAEAEPARLLGVGHAVACVSWDYDEPPDMGVLVEAINAVGGGQVHAREVHDGSQEYILAVSRQPLDDAAALAAWEAS